MESLAPKIAPVKLVVFDVDGVMTNAQIFMDSAGEWKRMFSVRDGIGIVRLREQGYLTAIITGAHSEDVRSRAKHLKIDYFFEGKGDKGPAFKDLKEKTGLENREIAYIGDDLPDAPIIAEVGFGATVPDAVAPVKEVASYTTQCPGGLGAVREFCELIIQYGAYAQGEGRGLS